MAMPIGVERAAHFVEQHIVELRIETGFNDQYMRHYAASPGIEC